MSQISRLTLAACASFGLLTACGGSGASNLGGAAGVPIVFADGSTPISGVNLVSYVGTTFPVKIAFGTTDGVDATVGTVTGSVNVIDADTLELSLNASAIGPAETITFTRQGSTDIFETDDGFTIDLDDLMAFQSFARETDPTGETDIFGGFGFQTPESEYRNDTVVYDVNSAGALYITTDGGDDFTFLGGQVDIEVDFANRQVTGQVIDASALIDIDDDDAEDDLLAITLDIDGDLSATGITGTLTGKATVDIGNGGGTPTDLGMVITSSTVDAALFGNNAELIAGVYDGDFTFNDPENGATGASLSGYFDAELD